MRRRREVLQQATQQAALLPADGADASPGWFDGVGQLQGPDATRPSDPTGVPGSERPQGLRMVPGVSRAAGPGGMEAGPDGGASGAAASPSGVDPQPPTAPYGARVLVQAATAAERLRFWTEQSSPEDEEDRDLLRQIRRRVFERTEGLPEREREVLARQIALEMAGKLSSRARQERIVGEVLSTLGGRLGPLEPLMRDATVSEVLVNAPDEVYAERRGRLERQDLRFRGDREVRALVEGIAAWAGRKFDWASPVLDCHLPDGSRLAAVRWPVALRGTAVSIRKFPLMPSWGDLTAMGALPRRDLAMSPSFLRSEPYPGDVDVGAFLAWALRRRVNLVVCGGTSSGKTTFLNAVMELVPSGSRMVIIEDSAELQPPGGAHVVRLEHRPPNLEGEGEVSLWALLVASLRLRPDIIVVGECRKNETAVMLEAMTTGHPGSMTTVHADSPLDALRRMVRMVRQDQPEVPSVELREYIASAVHLIVHFRRDESHQTGLRLVERVTAVEGIDASGQFVLADLYRWRDGHFRWTGRVPSWARQEGDA
jgi:pilus assembly protein CpaF